MKRNFLRGDVANRCFKQVGEVKRARLELVYGDSKRMDFVGLEFYLDMHDISIVKMMVCENMTREIWRSSDVYSTGIIL